MHLSTKINYLNNILCTYNETIEILDIDKYPTWGDLISYINEEFKKPYTAHGDKIEVIDPSALKDNIKEEERVFPVSSELFKAMRAADIKIKMKGDGRFEFRMIIYWPEDLEETNMHAEKIMSCERYAKYMALGGGIRVKTN